MTDPNPAATQSAFRRTEDYKDFYANTILYESSAWDLKVVFGQLDQSVTPNEVKQHLGVTIPWPQAKLALFWLRVQIEAAELAVATKIPIRKDLLPMEAPPLTPEEEDNPAARGFRDLYIRLREEFLGSL